ncbi:hypothetical protein VDGE_30536 [Verticillium dahliae]|uniref:HIT domain-containing protein n=1 Tax=Verticillium dahliae TaxID=27337 RepID=A0A444RKZ8_VERDA|nr:hypothetical protein VDGE_30536 [Verticillium dahliae]
MRERLVKATTAQYPCIEEDQLKLYVHYQPTYHHFHVHIVHVQLEAGATQATGKAVGYESIIETLGAMDANDDEAGMDSLTSDNILTPHVRSRYHPLAVLLNRNDQVIDARAVRALRPLSAVADVVDLVVESDGLREGDAGVGGAGDAVA